jgi:hypothetical protein
MPTNPPNTDNHNLPKVPPLDTEYSDEWGYIINNGEFSDGSDAGTPGLVQALEERTAVVDTESNLSNYTAYSDAIFIASDTGNLFLGDGTSWNQSSFGTSSSPVPDTSYFNAINVGGQKSDYHWEEDFRTTSVGNLDSIGFNESVNEVLLRINAVFNSSSSLDLTFTNASSSIYDYIERSGANLTEVNDSSSFTLSSTGSNQTSLSAEWRITNNHDKAEIVGNATASNSGFNPVLVEGWVDSNVSLDFSVDTSVLSGGTFAYYKR